jgi:hypothetical protein
MKNVGITRTIGKEKECDCKTEDWKTKESKRE